MRDIEIPAFFHEVFGERQSVLHIIVILLFGAMLSSVLFVSKHVYRPCTMA